MSARRPRVGRLSRSSTVPDPEMRLPVVDRAHDADRTDDTPVPRDTPAPREEAPATVVDRATPRPLPPRPREALVDVLARCIVARLHAEERMASSDAHNTLDAPRAPGAGTQKAPADRDMTQEG